MLRRSGKYDETESSVFLTSIFVCKGEEREYVPRWSGRSEGGKIFVFLSRIFMFTVEENGTVVIPEPKPGWKGDCTGNLSDRPRLTIS